MPRSKTGGRGPFRDSKHNGAGRARATVDRLIRQVRQSQVATATASSNTALGLSSNLLRDAAANLDSGLLTRASIDTLGREAGKLVAIVAWNRHKKVLTSAVLQIIRETMDVGVYVTFLDAAIAVRDELLTQLRVTELTQVRRLDLLVVFHALCNLLHEDWELSSIG